MGLTRLTDHQINSNIHGISDSIISLQQDHTGVNTNDIGFILNRGTSGNVGVIWDESAQTFRLLFTTDDGKEQVADVTVTSDAPLTVSNITINNTAGLIVPTGNVAQRIDAAGTIRFNSDANVIEGYDGTVWISLMASGGNAAPTSITIVGDDMTGNGVTGGNTTITLNTVNANVGVFGSTTEIPVVTVNGKGLITEISSTAISIPSANIIIGGDATGSGITGANTSITFNTVNANVGSFGNATHSSTITVNAKGLVISAVDNAISFPITEFNTRTGNITLTSTDVTDALAYTPYNATNPAGYITTGNVLITGDATGSGALNSNANITLNTVNANVGVFGSTTEIPVVTVNGKGLITEISSTAISIPSGNITITGDASGSGTTGANTSITFNTVNSNVGAFGNSAHVSQVTVNAKGLVTAVSNVAISFPITEFNTRTGNITLTSGDVTAALTYTPYNATNPNNYISGGNVTVTGDASGTGVINGNTAITFNTVNSTVGTFGNATQIPTVTVNGKGLVTAITTANVFIPSANIILVGDATGTGTTGANTSVTLATVNSNVGNFGDTTHVATYTVNGKGLITAASNAAIPLAVTITGDATGSGTTSSNTSITFNTVNSTTGTFGSASQVPQIVVNGKGLVTSASNISIPSAVTITGDATGSGTTSSNTSITLNTVNGNVGTFGSTTTIPVVTVNGKGLVTAVSTVAHSSNIAITGDATGTGNTGANTAITFNTVNSNIGVFTTHTVNAKGLVTAAGNLVATGDVTGTAVSSNIALTLATVNSNVGTFGNATNVASFTVNAKGLITAVSNVAISDLVGSGAVKQTVTSVVAATFGTTTVTPTSTLPTTAIGTQILSLAITPSATTSKVMFTGAFVVDAANSNRNIYAFFFRGTTCIGVGATNLASTGIPEPIPFQFVDSPASTSAQTYTIRVGISAGTWYVAQSSGANDFGGAYALNSVSLTELL